jgi:hypothetical protein
VISNIYRTPEAQQYYINYAKVGNSLLAIDYSGESEGALFNNIQTDIAVFKGMIPLS